MKKVDFINSLHNLSCQEPRPLPVIVAVDRSGSMCGSRMDALNFALNNFIESLQRESNPYVEIQVAFYSFGSEATCDVPLTSISSIKHAPNYAANGLTSMGMAFREIKDLIENLEYIAPKAYNPIIVVVTDGSPTDDHYTPLEAFIRGGRSAKSTRIAMALGEDADRKMLSRFVSEPEYLIYGHDEHDIIDYFEYVKRVITSCIAKETPEEIDRQVLRFFTSSEKNNGKRLIASLYALRDKIHTEIIPVLEKVSDITDLRRYYSQSEINLLLDNFPYIFKKYYSYDGALHSLEVEPSDIDNLIYALLKLSLSSAKRSNILIPYMGLNYVLQKAHEDEDTIDLVLSEHVSPFMRMAEEIFGDLHVKGILSENYIGYCLEQGRKYKAIIALPEFSQRFENAHGYEGLLQEEIIDMLNGLLDDGGEMYLLLKEEACHSKYWRRFRQFIATKTNKYETTIVNLPICKMREDGDVCLFIIKKCKHTGFSKPINIANLNLPQFKKNIQFGLCSLDIFYIVENIKSLDPQFFIRKRWQELYEGFNLSPLHYKISDTDRLEALVDRYLAQSLFYKGSLDNSERNAKRLIASLYVHIVGARQYHIEAISPLVQELDKEMSKANLTFLVKRFKEVVEYCLKKDSGLSNGVIFNKAYLSLIAPLLEETDLPEVPTTFLPFGNIQFTSIFPKTPFHCVESSSCDFAIAEIINTTLRLGGQVVSQESANHKLYGRIIAIPDARKADVTPIIDEICRCVDHKLCFGGKMAILLPREACYAANWEKLRRYLTHECKDITLSVISLNIPSSSSIEEESLFIIEKHLVADYLPSFQKVTLVDIDKKDFILADDIVGPYDIKVDAIIEAIKTKDSKSVRLVSINELDEGYNLLAARYFRFDCFSDNDKITKTLTNLKDVVTLIPRYNYEWVKANSYSSSERTLEKIVSVQDLSDNYLDCGIHVRQLKDKSSNSNSYTTSIGGYVAYSHGKILVGKIENIDETIIAIEDTICHFQVDPTKASLDYILKILSTQDYVVEQIKCLTKGYIWTDEYLHPEDLLHVCIELPSVKVQDIEVLADSQKGYAEKVIELENAFNEFKEDMHNKKHGIGQTIFAINNWMRLLKLARKRGNGVVNDCDIIGKNHPQSVSQIFENLEATMKRLQVQISKMDTGYEMIPSEFGITSFIEEFVNNHPRAEFEYINLVNHRAEKDLPVVSVDEKGNTQVSKTDFIFQKGDDLCCINFPLEALEIILENIISNACAHGFKDSEINYKIKISSEISGKYLSIFVANNGAPIHKDFSEKDVFKYAKSTSDALSGHHGFGGYEVWKLMKEFGGTSEFISTPEEEYTVTYKLTFPVSNILNIL